ncbi:MAG: hypothetical protein U0835_19020 [Isosphaeraceae bacterium]
MVVGLKHAPRRPQPPGRLDPGERGAGARNAPEYVTGEALAVNNAGVVAGTVDGPGGSPIGPNAFVHEGGKLRLVDEGGPNFSSATALNDNGQIAGVLEEPEPHDAHEHEPAKPAPPRRSPGPLNGPAGRNMT